MRKLEYARRIGIACRGHEDLCPQECIDAAVHVLPILHEMLREHRGELDEFDGCEHGKSFEEACEECEAEVRK